MALTFPAAPEAFAQQPCNPAVDGTYCATDGIKKKTDMPSTDSRRNDLSPTRDVGFFNAISDVQFYEQQPATLGAITFGASGRCIGIIRRVNCKSYD